LRSSSLANTGNTVTVKGSPLEYNEGDGNFVYLLTNMSGSNIAITGSTTINGNLNITGTTTATGSLFGTATTSSTLQGIPASGFITNVNDTYTSTGKITDVITLTQAEFNSISASASTSSFYIII